MKIQYIYIILFVLSETIISCTTLEKASLHGLTSGYYTCETEPNHARPVYVEVNNDQIDIYPLIAQRPEKKPVWSIPLARTDSMIIQQAVFKKQSLDVDITSILLKYRPAVKGSPAQMTADLNFALYAGWRHDQYRVTSKKDPLGKWHQKISSLGYDFGFFAGPGATLISPFTTQNRRADEYSGMIIQTGVAGFIESTVASFGISIGYDHLLNEDRKIWIYRNKPWVGFIVGIALN